MSFTATKEIIYKTEITEQQADRLLSIAAETVQERVNQIDKWGEQNWPDFPPDLVGSDVNQHYNIPFENEAKGAVETRFRHHEGTYGDILIEEVAEAFSSTTKAELRAELIQVAAVAQAWVEKIDRDLAKEAAA